MPARSRSSAREVALPERHVEPDAEHRPALLGPPLDEDPRHLAPVEQHVVGPLDLRRRARQLGHGDPGHQGQQPRWVADQERAEQRAPGRGAPRPALPPAPGRLLGRGDERSVGRAGGRQRPGALVGGVGQPEVEPRQAQRAHAGLIRTASSTAMPSRPARVAVADRDGQPARGVLVHQQRVGRHLGERPRERRAVDRAGAQLQLERATELEGDPRQLLVPDVQLDVPEPVDVDRVGHQRRRRRAGGGAAARAARDRRDRTAPRPRPRSSRRRDARRPARRCPGRGRWPIRAPGAAESARCRRPRPRRRSPRRRATAARCQARRAAGRRPRAARPPAAARPRPDPRPPGGPRRRGCMAAPPAGSTRRPGRRGGGRRGSGR